LGTSARICTVPVAASTVEPEKVSLPRSAVGAAVGELELDLGLLALAGPQAGVLGLRQREAHPERVAARDGGEQGRLRVGRDQAADGLLRAPVMPPIGAWIVV
jgi:hypothetical protein